MSQSLTDRRSVSAPTVSPWTTTEKTHRSYELWMRYVAPRFQGQLDVLEDNRNWIETRMGQVFKHSGAAQAKAFTDAGKELPEEMKKAMEGLLEPTIREVRLGAAEVRDTFKISKVGTIAGCLVQDGRVTRTAGIRLLRDNVVIHTGKVASLKRFKDDAGEVKAGLECGIGIAGYNDIKPGDVIEFFTTEKVKETL